MQLSIATVVAGDLRAGDTIPVAGHGSGTIWHVDAPRFTPWGSELIDVHVLLSDQRGYCTIVRPDEVFTVLR